MLDYHGPLLRALALCRRVTAVSFSTIAEPDPDGMLFIEVPAHVMDALGDKKRIPVNVTLNGISYRSTIAVYGGTFYLPARKEIREAAKLAPGSART